MYLCKVCLRIWCACMFYGLWPYIFMEGIIFLLFFCKFFVNFLLFFFFIFIKLLVPFLLEMHSMIDVGLITCQCFLVGPSRRAAPRGLQSCPEISETLFLSCPRRWGCLEEPGCSTSGILQTWCQVLISCRGPFGSWWTVKNQSSTWEINSDLLSWVNH